eukprot:2948631-Rhodomonas_salina.1
MDWEADVLVNEALQEWLEGRRTVWFGDAEQGTQTQVFATYTPPGAYWLDLEGARLAEFVEGVHNVNPSSHDYLTCMLLLHGFVHSAGYKNVGPVRAYSTLPRRPDQKTNTPQPAPWKGKRARYCVLVLSWYEARAIIFSMADAKVVKCYERGSFLYSKFRCVAKLSTTDDTIMDDAISYHNQTKYSCCFQPTGIDEADLLTYIKISFNLPLKQVVLKHRLEEAIFAKIVRDVPWAHENLLAVEVMVQGATGQWDKQWIITMWRTLRHCRAFYLINTNTSFSPSPN